MLRGALECWPSYVAVPVLCNAGREDIRYRAKLNLEDHFAELRAGFEVGVCLRASGQRKHAINHGPEASRSDKFHHGKQLRFCAHVRAEQRKLPAEKEAEVHPGVESGGGPACHQPPGGRQAGEAFIPSGGANVFEDDINSALPCDAAHFVADFLRFVIDEMIRAKLFALLQLHVAASRGNHTRAEEFCNLDRGAPHAAIQIAKFFGARVIATAGSDVKLQKGKELGADHLINHKTQKIRDEVRRITGKRGVDVVFEHVGTATWDESFASLAPSGRLVTCGATTGFDARVDLRFLFSRQLSLLGSYMGTKSELLTGRKLVAAGRFRPVVDRVFPLAACAEAHAYLESSSQFGKVVLKV